MHDINYTYFKVHVLHLCGQILRVTLWKAYFQQENDFWTKLLTHGYNGHFQDGPQCSILMTLDQTCLSDRKKKQEKKPTTPLIKLRK